MPLHYSMNPGLYNVLPGDGEGSSPTVRVLDRSVTALDDFMKEHLQQSEEQGREDPFYVVNLGDVVGKLQSWREKLPRVEPFYAVKCNDDPGILQTLATLGTGFDCASKAEIGKVLSLGVTPERVIYAHPCKTTSHIRFAAAANVHMTTFDNEPELHKIKALHPTAQLVLRICADDPKAVWGLDVKFGATLSEAKHLLAVARELDLTVIGVSFHVGSGCVNADAHAAAISTARHVFDHANSVGLKLTLLDIGGGFPGLSSATVTFEEIADNVNLAIENHFPPETGVRIIAEPGRYFVESALTLYVNIIAKRITDTEQMANNASAPKFKYYVNDGVYGSINRIINDPTKEVHIKVPALYNMASRELQHSSVWGPTCCGQDCILKSCWLPELNIGQWLYSDDMGAYTCSISSTFNGFAPPYMVYVIATHEYDLLTRSQRVLRSTPCTVDKATKVEAV